MCNAPPTPLENVTFDKAIAQEEEPRQVICMGLPVLEKEMSLMDRYGAREVILSPKNDALLKHVKYEPFPLMVSRKLTSRVP